ncbi:MAG: hypothetical protein J0I41_07790 [Filimonas sp.]|nr:hypothetical protein [Filimonas sp.]
MSDSTKQCLKELQMATIRQQSQLRLKQLFLQARTHYKKWSILSEYLNPYESKFINGPSQVRIEEGAPDKLIPPHGFQLLEEIIFEHKINASASQQIIAEINFMQQQIDKMTSTYALENAFTVKYINEAMRYAIFSLGAKDIAGFDSPVAVNSIAECIATLTGIDSISAYTWKENKQLQEIINNAKKYLSDNDDFNTFNRIVFIKEYINPLSTLVSYHMREESLFNLKNDNAVSDNALTLFDKNFFDVDFFSPSERYMPTEDRVALGKMLFNDPVLSQSQTISCSSCHNESMAFTDGRARAKTIDKSAIRNTPTLWNALFQTRFFYDMREEILEDQFLDVVHSSAEMNGSISQIIERLTKDSVYNHLFLQAYATEANPISPFTIANAISNYERTLISVDSRFDRFMRGDETAVTTEEKEGFNLFMGKAKCGTCHFAPLFNGLVPPFYNEVESEIIGVPATKNKRSATIDPDYGRYNFTKSPVHKYAFRIPGLRNVALTAPYMHNGVYATLDEVMEFYNNGGGKGLGIHTKYYTLPEGRLNLSKVEIKRIISFMQSLTDIASANE